MQTTSESSRNLLFDFGKRCLLYAHLAGSQRCENDFQTTIASSAASHPEEQTVKRECAGTSHHNRQGESQHRKVVLNAFARLFAAPVHEESVLRVNNAVRDDNVAAGPQV